MQFGNFGIWQIVIIVVVILLVVGPRRLPQFVKSVGQTFFQFRREVRSFKRDIDIFADIDDEDDAPVRPRRRRHSGPAPEEGTESRERQVDSSAAGTFEPQKDDRPTVARVVTPQDERKA